MKKYRCPYCGEEGISLWQKYNAYDPPNKGETFGSFDGNRSYLIEHSHRGWRRQFSFCKNCHNLLRNHYTNKLGHYTYLCLIFIPILIFIALAIWHNPLFIIAILSYVFILVEFVLLPLDSILLCNYTCCSDNLEAYMPKANAKIEIIDAKKQIKNLSVLGVRFSKNTTDRKFHEAFENDIIPAIFFKKSKICYEVRFMKTKFIPVNLYTVNAEFTVIDNGKEVAKGMISEIFEVEKSQCIH